MTTATRLLASSSRVTVITRIADFESGESWSNTVDDAVAGHFVEGSQGKKVTGSPSYTEAAHIFGAAQDYSAMAPPQRFRMWAYVADLADASGADPTLAIRFVDPINAGFYFQKNYAAAALVNGGQYLTWAKADMATVGTPTWASILTVRVFLFGATSTIAATCDDLCIIS